MRTETIWICDDCRAVLQNSGRHTGLEDDARQHIVDCLNSVDGFVYIPRGDLKIKICDEYDCPVCDREQNEENQPRWGLFDRPEFWNKTAAIAAKIEVIS